MTCGFWYKVTEGNGFPTRGFIESIQMRRKSLKVRDSFIDVKTTNLQVARSTQLLISTVRNERRKIKKKNAKKKYLTASQVLQFFNREETVKPLEQCVSDNV